LILYYKSRFGTLGRNWW